MALDRNALIRELGESFQAANREKEAEEERRFYENTSTLMSDEDLARMRQIEEEQRKEGRHILALQMNEFSDVLLGKRPFLVTKDIGYMQGDSVVVREYDNLKATGQMTVKILTRVEKEVEGLVKGYCVIGWE